MVCIVGVVIEHEEEKRKLQDRIKELEETAKAIVFVHPQASMKLTKTPLKTLKICDLTSNNKHRTLPFGESQGRPLGPPRPAQAPAPQNGPNLRSTTRRATDLKGGGPRYQLNLT